MNSNSFLFGVKINLLQDYEDAYMLLIKLLQEEQKEYIVVNNVHTVVEAVLNSDYKKILNQSLLSLPDGKPLSLYLRMKGVKNINRIFGPTFMEYAINKGQNDRLKHFFFGSTEDTINKMLRNISIKYPQTKIAGYYFPPFKK